MATTLLLILNLVWFTPGSGDPSEIAVIVNKSVPVESIDAETLARIYKLQKKKWDDGAKIVVLNLKSDRPIKDRFYEFIGVKPIFLRKLWLRYELTGEAEPPKALETHEEILEFVATTPGAIGYIPAAAVTEQIRVVAKK